MTRRQMREHAFKELFLTEFYQQEEFASQCSVYLEEQENLEPDVQEELWDRALRMSKRVPELDKRINAVAEGWKTGRMGKVDLTILRLALYEILYDDGVPVKVAINEAVEIAKKYGGEDSASFVNAILGKLVKGL